MSSLAQGLRTLPIRSTQSVPNLVRLQNMRTKASNGTTGTTGSVVVPRNKLSLFEAMGVFGPAPERINCRLSMLMFFPMALREMETSESIVEQFLNPNYGYVALCCLMIWASMIPILKNVKDEDFGFMSVRAEKVNGRAAMLAWAVLLALEHQGGGACFF
ncbi:Early light-induced protein 2 [Picochlorum sp. SENEW3]|nr:Early light-induced protein 2 [Picochlorum sp. SENEW3]